MDMRYPPSQEGDECGGGSAVLRGGGQASRKDGCREVGARNQRSIIEAACLKDQVVKAGGLSERYLVESTAGAEGG